MDSLLSNRVECSTEYSSTIHSVTDSHIHYFCIFLKAKEVYENDKKRHVASWNRALTSKKKNQTNQIQPSHTELVLNILPKFDICIFQLFDYLM